MCPHTTWKPGGILDVTMETAPEEDPEAWMYRPEFRWVLVKSGEALEQEGWDRRTIVVVTLEAMRERPWLIDWRDTPVLVLYVRASSVEGLPEGPVASMDRFALRDSAARLASSRR
jgi:hypothetical protein